MRQCAMIALVVFAIVSCSIREELRRRNQRNYDAANWTRPGLTYQEVRDRLGLPVDTSQSHYDGVRVTTLRYGTTVEPIWIVLENGVVTSVHSR